MSDKHQPEAALRVLLQGRPTALRKVLAVPAHRSWPLLQRGRDHCADFTDTPLLCSPTARARPAWHLPGGVHTSAWSFPRSTDVALAVLCHAASPRVLPASPAPRSSRTRPVPLWLPSGSPCSRCVPTLVASLPCCEELGAPGGSCRSRSRGLSRCHRAPAAPPAAAFLRGHLEPSPACPAFRRRAPGRRGSPQTPRAPLPTQVRVPPRGTPPRPPPPPHLGQLGAPLPRAAAALPPDGQPPQGGQQGCQEDKAEEQHHFPPDQRHPARLGLGLGAHPAGHGRPPPGPSLLGKVGKKKKQGREITPPKKRRAPSRRRPSTLGARLAVPPMLRAGCSAPCAGGGAGGGEGFASPPPVLIPAAASSPSLLPHRTRCSPVPPPGRARGSLFRSPPAPGGGPLGAGERPGQARASRSLPRARPQGSPKGGSRRRARPPGRVRGCFLGGRGAAALRGAAPWGKETNKPPHSPRGPACTPSPKQDPKLLPFPSLPSADICCVQTWGRDKWKEVFQTSPRLQDRCEVKRPMRDGSRSPFKHFVSSMTADKSDSHCTHCPAGGKPLHQHPRAAGGSRSSPGCCTPGAVPSAHPPLCSSHAARAALEMDEKQPDTHLTSRSSSLQSPRTERDTDLSSHTGYSSAQPQWCSFKKNHNRTFIFKFFIMQNIEYI